MHNQSKYKLTTHPPIPPSRLFNLASKILCTTIICASLMIILGEHSYAATDIWSKANTILKDVYSRILGISTIAAIVTSSVALLMMNFSRSGKTVDESRSWLKRIAITWAILNGLGFIMAYITPFFQGGKWSG